MRHFKHHSCTWFSPFSFGGDEFFFYVKISALCCCNEGWRWWRERTNDASLPASSAVGPYYWKGLSNSLLISAPAPTFAIPHVEKWQPRSQKMKHKSDLVKWKAAINEVGHVVLISRAFIFSSFFSLSLSDALGSHPRNGSHSVGKICLFVFFLKYQSAGGLFFAKIAHETRFLPCWKANSFQSLVWLRGNHLNTAALSKEQPNSSLAAITKRTF